MTAREMQPLTPGSIRVVIADDQEVVRAGFAALIDGRDDMTVVGTARDGEDAIEVAHLHHPDVILMDVRMPVMNGIEATRRIVTEIAPPPRVIALTTFNLDEYVYEALSAGASGFLLKDGTAETLFEAVRVVAAGDALLTPNVTRRLIDEFVRTRPRFRTDAQDWRRTGQRCLTRHQVAGRRQSRHHRSAVITQSQTSTAHVEAALAKHTPMGHRGPREAHAARRFRHRFPSRGRHRDPRRRTV